MDRRRFLKFSSAAAVTATLPHPGAVAAALASVSEPKSDIAAVTGDGNPVSLARAAVQELADALRGRLLLPGMDGYESARRVLNYSIDKHPALIAQCTGAADVQYAVDFARSNDLLLAVKCGGHSFSGKGTCDGGLMIDLSRLRGARVNPASRTAWVDGGSLLGQMDHETAAFGLVTTAGTVSHTGIGGLTLGGGYGRLGRRFGLTLDNVKGVEIVTADGRFRRANGEENPDLYWAVRGGGGNFGVVTSFEMQLHPFDRSVIAGRLVFPLPRARDVLEVYAEFTEDAPRELYADYMIVAPPGSDGVVVLSICYIGSQKDLGRVLDPLRKLGKPMVDDIKDMDYVALQRSGDNDDPRTTGTYQKSGFISGVSPELAARAVEGFQADPNRLTLLYFQHCGGAISDVAPNATAFAHRAASHNMFCTVTWPLEADAASHLQWLRSYWATLDPYTSGFYMNDIADEGQQVVNRNYGVNYERLVQVKNQYDPTNLFRLNANVVPTA
jgi:FAD/FMN-containing dehydrogenase